jgi:Carboxypeptidase regulatory-like domain
MKRILFVLVALLLITGSGLAQTTFATITGAVTDPTGSALVGAKIEAVHVQSGYKYDAQANESGVYTLSNLREGAYDIKIAAPGFRESRTQGLTLVSREIRRLDVKMEVGEVTTSVEVQAQGAAVIETETARISQTRTSQELKDLPLNTRSVTAFLALVPGVGQATTVTSTYRFAGSRRNQSEFTIDGISNVTSNGTQASPLTNYIESFDEARIDIVDNAADTGAIGQVTVVSKSGTNTLHGSAFDYYGTPVFRARDPFALQRPSGISHRPGFSVGGPVYVPRVYNGHNRTFFFFSFETSRGSTVQNNLNPTVPLEAWRTGNFSSQLPGTIVKDPTNGQAFPGNIIPANRLNPVAVKLQNLFYPTPNFGNTSVLQSQNFRQSLTHPFDPNTYWTTRIDHRFSQRFFVYGRYTWQRQHSTDYESNLPTVGRLTDTRDTRNAVVSVTNMITPTLVNEVRYGYMLSNEPRWGAQDGSALVQQLGFTGLVPNLPDLPGIPNLTWSGLGLTTVTQTGWRVPGFYNRNNVVQENLSWSHGRHMVRGGMMWGYYNANDDQASNGLYGNLQFSNKYTGFAYSDFLLGLPTTMQRAAPPTPQPWHHPIYDFFVTDEFKVHPKLTINFGARYEIHPHWGSGNGTASLFDMATGQIVVQDGSLSKVSPLMPKGYVNVVEASKLGYAGSALINTDTNNVGPRVGIAWRPFDEKTVIRAGFGVYYDIVPTVVTTAGTPFVVNEPSQTNSTTNPVTLPQVFPSTTAALTTVSLPGAFKKDLRIPYSLQYNVTIERQFGKMGVRLSYVGTGTRQGEIQTNVNQPVASTVLYTQKPRPFQQYPAITYTTNGGGHQYNALTAEVKRRFSSGLLYDFSWTWARDVGDLERDQAPEDAYNIQRERAAWEDIPTHRITGDVIYELPFGRGKKFLSRGRLPDLAFGGWQVMAASTWNTGFFLTPQWSGPDSTNTRFTSGSVPTATLRPNALHNPNLPSDQRSVNNWFDLTAFGPPSPGSFGTSAKGVIVGPGAFTVDSGIAKNFLFTERLHLRVEFTATNILNHPNWGNPGLTTTSLASAGVISSTGNGGGGLDSSGARSCRLGVRLEW